jgi:hypothetical protein
MAPHGKEKGRMKTAVWRKFQETGMEVINVNVKKVTGLTLCFVAFMLELWIGMENVRELPTLHGQRMSVLRMRGNAVP